MAKKSTCQDPPAQVCYVCNEATESGNFRTIARGDRKGDTVGPLCPDCEATMDRFVMLEDVVQIARHLETSGKHG